MVDPGVLDITIHQGATFNLDLQYKDSTGAGVDMTGFTVESKIVDRTTTNTLATFTTTFTDRAVGKFNLKLSSTVTTGIAVEGLYDVLVTEPSGEKFFLLQGRTKLDPGITGVI
tara:strand:- start:188 stop:529 length:342 start_codon:yes stop_codon:yes gene_type:complete